MKLTREQRFLLMRGGCPRLAFPADQPLDARKGQIVKLSKHVEIEITGVTRTKKGEKQIEYLLRDLRPTLLRRTPQVHQPESDDEGFVAPPEAADIEAARLESSYTHSPRGAIGDAGEAVPEVDQVLLSMQARTKWAQRTDEQNRKRERAVRDRLRETLNGLDSDSQVALLAALEREIQRAAEPKECAA